MLAALLLLLLLLVVLQVRSKTACQPTPLCQVL
jgi:hypothetical protein